MEKKALLLILVLMTGAVNKSAAKNLCDGIKDGEEGTNGVYYWRCKGGAIKSVGCEGSANMFLIRQDYFNIGNEMPLKCVPKVLHAECILPTNITHVYKLKTALNYRGNDWLCEERGFVANPKRFHSTWRETDMCHHQSYSLLYTVKPGNCAYIANGGEGFVIECIADEQNPTVPKEARLRKASKGEIVEHCAQYAFL